MASMRLTLESNRGRDSMFGFRFFGFDWSVKRDDAFKITEHGLHPNLLASWADVIVGAPVRVTLEDRSTLRAKACQVHAGSVPTDGRLPSSFHAGAPISAVEWGNLPMMPPVREWQRCLVARVH